MPQSHDPSRPGLLRAGKLPHADLRRLLGTLGNRDPRVLLGPDIGRDAALISFGSTTLIAKTDPVTFATDEIGWYAVQVNANDIAVSGGTPKWFLATVLLPEGESLATAEKIFAQMKSAADSLDVTLVGGHTEITIGLPRPIVAGMMLGEAPPSETISAAGARTGDSVILSRGIAIEGTAILATELRDRLKGAGVPEAIIDRAANLLHDPGISVVQAAAAARSTGGVTAMHDPTEGGLATALAELAEASQAGLVIDAGSVHVLPETEAICAALGADPWGLIASGALLLTAHPASESAIIEAMASRGVDALVIGQVVERTRGLVLRHARSESTVPVFERDEIARILET